MTSFSNALSSTANLTEYLKLAASVIQEQMMLQLPQKEPKQFLYDLIGDYPTRGGKKFRSALVLLSSELFNGSSESSLNTAIALELFQSNFLPCLGRDYHELAAKFYLPSSVGLEG